MNLLEIVKWGGLVIILLIVMIGGNLVGFPIGVWIVTKETSMLRFVPYGVGLVIIGFVGLFGKFVLEDYLEKREFVNHKEGEE